MKKPIYLSVIVPVHNEARRLERCMSLLIPDISQYLHEIILVDNGSTDDTPRLCEQATRIYPHVRTICLDERGKGLAVRTGMLAAQGWYRYMCDCDLSTPASEIHRFIVQCRKYDVVIGSREKDRTQVSAALSRRIIGRSFHQVVAGILPNISDTQCGFKMFRDYVAMRIFEQCRVDGMAFDVEALKLASLLRYSIHEMPVPWVHDADSRVRMGSDSLEMLLDVLSLYGRSVKGEPVTMK
jgi:dolichyl-phosphate beta-glucosyltransferase